MAKKLIGTAPDQIPTNADLGSLAYQDANNATLGGLTVDDVELTGGERAIRIYSETASGGGSVMMFDRTAADKQAFVMWDSDQLYAGVPASNTSKGVVGTKEEILSFETQYATRVQVRSNVNQSGNAGLQILTGYRIGFDETGVRSWNIKAQNGNLEVFSGDGNGVLYSDAIGAAAGATDGYRLHTNSGIVASANYMSFFTGQTQGWGFLANTDGADADPVFKIKTNGYFTSPGLYLGDDAHWKLRANNANKEFCLEYSTSTGLSDGNIRFKMTSLGYLNIWGNTHGIMSVGSGGAGDPTVGNSYYSELQLRTKGNANTNRNATWTIRAEPESEWGNPALQFRKIYDGTDYGVQAKFTSGGDFTNEGYIHPENYRHDYYSEYSYREPFTVSQAAQTQTWEWTCGSYAMFEVLMINHQTNGGSSANKYVRGIWANNHTNHQWQVLDDFGSLPNASFTFAATDSTGGTSQASGKLKVTMNYSGNYGSTNAPRFIIREFVGSIGSYTHTST